MRVHYMDALRSVLMAIGVFYHGAALYMANDDWRLPAEQGHPFFDALVELIHGFRMPAFFVVAGYFCLLTLQRYGENGFLMRRLQRIGIPLLATALLVNTVMNYLSWQNFQHVGFFAYITDPAYVRDGVWVGHLWFLNNLLIYFFAAWLVAKLVRLAWPAAALRALLRTVDGWAEQPVRLLLLVVALPLTTMVLVRPAWRLEDGYLGHFIEPTSLVTYLPFFLFGMLMYRSRPLLETLADARFWLGSLTLAIGAAVLPVAGARDYLFEFATLAYAWGMAGLCLALFRQLFDRPSPFFRYFADASYTIYLLHQLVVVALGLVLERVQLNLFVKYALVVVATFAITAAAHHFLVLRIGVLRLLFNGKSLRDEAPAGRPRAATAER